jgi:hypothetical protein
MVDCISCSEISDRFLQSYSKLNPNTKIVQQKFLAVNVEDIDISKVLKSYESGDLIITPNISYASAIVINDSINFLAKNNIIFIGGDQWGPAEVSYVGKISSPYTFEAYRIVPWSINESSLYGEEFRNAYKEIFHKPPSLISFITFKTIMQNLKYIDLNQDSQKKAILNNFKKSTNDIKRNNVYSVYKVSKNKEELIGSITIDIKD